MKRVTGEDGARVRLEGLPYAQIPDRAIMLSGHAYKLLGRLQRIAGSKASVEVDDQDLGQWIKRSRQTVQRAWKELEAAGLIERRHRGGRRRILLLYTLAGRETAQGRMVHACLTERRLSETSACLKNEPRMAQGCDMHGSDLRRPLKEERGEKEQQRAAAPPQDVVVSSLPREEEEETPPTRPAFLAALVADLADALTSPEAKRTAAGTSPKDPRRPQ